MTNEERDIISRFIARVGGASQGSTFGSVPQTQQPALPPIDRDADNYISQQFNQYPEARYRITQLAFVQENALVEAQNRIQRLEWELQQARQAQQQSGQRQGGGGLFGGLFGGGNRQQSGPQGDPRWGQGGPQQQYGQSAPPPPQYPPNYQQGMFQQRGSGFLGSALTTAAGVAGGVVAGNALMNLFSPHQAAGGFAAPDASPWGAPAGGAVDSGSWNQDQGAASGGDQNYIDNGSWDQSGGGGGDSWNDNSGGDSSWTDNSGGGWDSGGNSDDTF